MEEMILTIDRSKWVRGDIGGSSSLLNDHGYMCCLGFYALACGLTKEQILHQPEPITLYQSGYDIPEQMQWLLSDDDGEKQNSDICIDLIEINDSQVFDSEQEREATLINAFMTQDIKVTFVN